MFFPRCEVLKRFLEHRHAEKPGREGRLRHGGPDWSLDIVRTAPGKTKPGEIDQKPYQIQKITPARMAGVAHVLGNGYQRAARPAERNPRYPPDLPKSLFAAGGTRMKLPDPFHQPSKAFLDLHSEHVPKAVSSSFGGARSAAAHGPPYT